MSRSRVWQGFLDWLRPVDRLTDSDAGSDRAPDDLVCDGTSSVPPERSRIRDRHATLARIEAESGAEIIPFPGQGSGTSAQAGEAVLDDPSPDAELMDFLAADLDPVPADPAFRERLRDELWEMIVEEGVGAPSDEKDV